MTTRPASVFLALFPFALGYLMSYLLRAVNAVVAPELVKDFGLGPAELGLLTAAYLLAFCAFQLPLGVLLDRFGPRRVQTVLLLISAAGCALFAFAPGFAVLFAARALIGLGFSAGLMASYKASSLWVPRERRSLANAAIMSMGALGLVVATEPTALLTAAVGWRHVFLIFAALIVAASLFIFTAAPEEKSDAPVTSFGQQWGELLNIMKLPLFRRVAPLLGLTAGIPIAYQTLWAGPWYRDVMGLAPFDVARHLFWMAVAFMFGILIVGVVADRLQQRGIGPMKTLMGLLALHTLAQAVIVFQVQALAFPAWLVLSAVGQSAILAFPWFARQVGENLSGRANATINFSMFVAAFAVQYGVGLIIGRFATTGAGYASSAYTVAMGICLGLQLLALIWYLWPREEQHPQ